MFCPQGEVICEDGEAKVCDGMGGFESMEACPDECVDGLGCVACIPGESECDGPQVMVCNDDGTMLEPGDLCDDVQGVMCDPDLGQCVGACSSQSLGLSYIGCDYYPTVLQQLDFYNNAPQQEYAVAVANTGNVIVNVTVTQGGNNITTFQVPADSAVVEVLPWVNALTKGEGPSVMVPDGAYRLRSDGPVTVYQYNPFNSTVTNDASLLLPVNTWGDRYSVASFPPLQFGQTSYPGIYAVVASEDGTTVDLSPSPSTTTVQAGGGVAADGTGQIMLDEGDVLQVFTAPGSDLTGTIVNADAPIQVFGGHDCSYVPLNVSACDHLEESMVPHDALSTEYIIVPPVQVPNENLAKAQVVRVIATEDTTQVTFDPDQGVDQVLANAGDFIELTSTQAAFKVTGDKKILVAQYMVGQSAGFGTSDPAMVMAVPTEQYRDNYLFHAATTWTENWVDLIAPDGASIQVDGAAVGGWAPIGATGFSVAHVMLDNQGDGNHRVMGDQDVGITVYGVQSFGSYWYPGGLDLDLIPE